jgi:hypothetical protein
MKRRAVVGTIGLVAAMALAAACGAVGSESTTQTTTDGVPGGGTTGGGTTTGGGNGGAGQGGAGSTGQGGAAAATGVPCDVADVMKQCTSCHGHPLSGGAPFALVTYDELVAKDGSGKTAIERSVAAMQSGAMPPGGGATGVDVLNAWIASGEPKGQCGGGAGGSGQTTTTTTDTNTNTSAVGVPCDVADVFSKHCFNCHGHPLAGGVTVPLVTYDELTAAAPGFAGQTVAQRAVARMQAGSMPPAGQETPASAGEIAAVQAWIGGGYTKGDCGADAGPSIDAGPDPFAGPPVCTSNSYYQGGENGHMRPGEACISCHAKEWEAPKFAIAGTVFPTGHEPNDCNAPAAKNEGATVVITDANGTKHTLTPNSAGNFYYEGSIATPYTAKVVDANGTREMFAKQSDGDCNKCHTQNGANGAPGRILLP